MALRIGIVGAGRTGSRRARQLERYPDVQLVGIADPNRSARDKFSRTFGARLAVSDHRRLASDKGVDVLYVCSPPASHGPIAVDCLQAGKHVICEEPMAVTMAQADEMMSAAETAGRRLFIALAHRYDPAYQEVARLVDAGEVGYPFLTLASHLRNDLDRLNDWHDWLGTWETGGGGVLMRYGSAIIDLLQYFLGEVGAVSAVCTRFATQPLNKAEDSCLLGLEFVDDAAAEVAITGAARYSAWPGDYSGAAMRLEVYGLEGSIQATSSPPRLITVMKDSTHKIISESEIDTGLPNDMDRDFLDCMLQEDGEPLVGPEDARSALKVILAGYKSSQMKRRVETLEHL